MKTRCIVAILAVAVFGSLGSCKKSDSRKGTTIQIEPHPFDPLDTREIELVKEVLMHEQKIDTTFRFFVINLQEPAKATMAQYRDGQSFSRRAFSVLYDRAQNRTFEAVVDLTEKKTMSFKQIAGVTPGGLLDDYKVDLLLKENSEWLDGLKKRGIHPDSVGVTIVFAGEMGIAPPDHRELICAPQFINKKYHEMLIDGMVAHVDLTDKKVLKVFDDGGKNFYKPEDINYFQSDVATTAVPRLKPMKTTMPEGNSFSVDGYKISGTSWSMRVGIDNREGLIIHNASFNDHLNWRPVLYRASVAEMYVPYGSTDLNHAAWNYYDAGAYRMGQSMPDIMSGMKIGADVPDNAVFIPGFFHNEKGKAYRIDSVIAVYEEYGGPLTRHGKFSQGSRNLVVKYFTKIWNYDYSFRWIFHEDGTIDLKAELTGIVGIKAVNRTTDLPGGNDETYKGNYYGTLVAPHVEAVNHQHFFSFRLDLDVDGAQNLVEEMNTVSEPAGKTNPWNNAFVKQNSVIKSEQQGQRKLNPSSNRHWMIADSRSVNALGHAKSYVLMPGSNAAPYAAEGSGPRKMADFLENQVWVTAYKEGESYPAGDYPNSRGMKDGLPEWIKNDENLVGNDIVMWYNLGITHIVRPEDWPIMNTHTIGFTLMPFGFFDENPVIANRGKGSVARIAGPPVPPDLSLCVPLPEK